MHFEIRDTGLNLVRILDWGYKNNTTKSGPGFNYLDLYLLAAGRYRNLVRDTSAGFPQSVCRPSAGGVSGDMNGAAQWWDAKNTNNVLVPNATYFINLFVDGSFVSQKQITKAFP